jgi:uncharacterized protein YjbI with pentapeptide repeats
VRNAQIVSPAMPFHRIDLLPNYDHDQAWKSRERWAEDGGVSAKVIELIRDGGGEEFLEREFERGQLGFMKDRWDLAGLRIFNEDIKFPKGNNFKSINLSYAQFWHSKFDNAAFFQSYFGFVRLFNVEFCNCVFAYSQFYGAQLEECKFINCEFVGESGFSNCEILDTKFDNCFFDKNKIFDCKFDENVLFVAAQRGKLIGLRSTPSSNFKSTVENADISGIYCGIKEAFISGQIFAQARKYFFLQQQAYTKYSRVWFVDKAKGYLWEFVAGYGVKPSRVLISLAVLFILVAAQFAYLVDSIEQGMLFSAGAFFAE